MDKEGVERERERERGGDMERGMDRDGEGRRTHHLTVLGYLDIRSLPMISTLIVSSNDL